MRKIVQVPFTLKNPLINCVFFLKKKNTKNQENAKTSSLVQHHSCEQIMPIFLFRCYKGRVEDSLTQQVNVSKKSGILLKLFKNPHLHPYH